MATWEYCQLSRGADEQDGDLYQVTYFSADLVQDVENGVERDEFSGREEALGYLGDEGWEAFHIDADGNWFLKRPDDWDEDDEWDDEDWDEEE
ncbi:MAG: hypothetical protein ACRDJC_17805 [Thermomicrobiales bacterium]